jgi:molecular chaperone GrpE
MIKKKTPDQNETRQQDHIETADNKENVPAQEAVPEETSLEEKLAEMQDKYLRLSAEFDNYRRRTLREKMELSKNASEDVLLNILPFMDDFERAMSHLDTATDSAAMKEGIDLIYLKLTEFLKQYGVREIESMNCEFNVDLHHAVAKVQVQEEVKKGKIVEVVQKGYYLQDKVIRHSKVIVGE